MRQNLSRISRRPGKIAAIGVLACVFAAGPAVAASTLLDFEDQPAGTTLTSQYGPRGVLFPERAMTRQDVTAHSGSRVVFSGDPSTEFHSRPLVVLFTSAQKRVRLFAGSSATFPVGPNGTLKAFDSSGALVAQDGPKPVANRAASTLFSIEVPAASIVRIELGIGTAEFEIIDDLEFEGDAPRPGPASPPVVRISSPAPGSELDGALRIEALGTVDGEQLLPSVTVRWDFQRPPEDSSGPLINIVSLSGSGASRTFRDSLGGLPSLGSIKLTVEAENAAGQKGSATVTFNNLPAAIRSRAGGERGFGTFRWGADTPACRIAVYERGAIALAGGATRTIRDEIFTKWLSLRDPIAGAAGRLGCPLGEQRSVAPAIAQDFQQGRIYARLPGSAYVPTVFANAIDKLGGEAANGFPIADPTDYTGGPFPVWLFQRFVRPGRPGLPSTFEIRGTPPVLLVERPGGDLTTLAEAGIPLSESSPTLWEQFPCSGPQGPCDIAPSRTEPSVTRAGSHCDLGTFTIVGPPAEPPAWKAIAGDHTPFVAAGIVRDSHRASWDNPLVHEHKSGPLDGFSSDWNLKVSLLPPYRKLLTPGQKDLEIEFEYYFAQYFFVAADSPSLGDLLWTSGRWIVDCAHTPYRTEIHPPSALAYLRTETFEGKPSTVAHIWVSSYYNGEPLELDLFPPPRPSPDAVALTVVKTADSSAVFNLSVEDTWVDGNQIRLRFSATRRDPKVTRLGEMKWPGGRGYEGTWRLSWTP